jgi:hypothetical protein
LIGDAEAVTMIHVAAQQADLDRDRPWLDRIVRHMARHGVEAQPEESASGGIAISDLLLSRVAGLRAELIVAGLITTRGCERAYSAGSVAACSIT